MKKGYTIAILCLLLVIGVLCVGIYFDLFHEQGKDEKAVNPADFAKAMQDIEDSKTVGSHVWILPDPDGQPQLFRYDKPLTFTPEILKENKAALLHTTLKTEYVTCEGYYELYYEDGWKPELTDGKPVMYVEKTTYHYNDATGVYTNGSGTYVNVLSVEPSLDAAKSHATVELVYEHTLYEAFTCDFNALTGELHVCLDQIRFLMQYNVEKGHWDVDSNLFAELYFTKTDEIPNKDRLQTYRADFCIQDENGKVWITGEHLAKTEVLYNADAHGYVIALTFTETGTALFAQTTEENVGRKLSIYVNDELLQTSLVNAPITGGEAIITSFATYEDALAVTQIIRFAMNQA